MKIIPKIIKASFFYLLLIVVSCVQQKHEKTVVFRVDMNAAEHINGVAITGEFTSPPWSEKIPLTDNDNDGIYQLSLTDQTAVSEMEFKFVTSDGTYELQDQGNRVLRFEYRPETIVYEAIFNQPEGKQTVK